MISATKVFFFSFGAQMLAMFNNGSIENVIVEIYFDDGLSIYVI